MEVKTTVSLLIHCMSLPSLQSSPKLTATPAEVGSSPVFTVLNLKFILFLFLSILLKKLKGSREVLDECH